MYKKRIYIREMNTVTQYCKKKKSGNIHIGRDFYDTFCELISAIFLTM